MTTQIGDVGVVPRRGDGELDLGAVADNLVAPLPPEERHYTESCEECGPRGIRGYEDGIELYCDCEHGRRKHYEHFRRIQDRFGNAGIPERLKGKTMMTLRERGGKAVMRTPAVRAAQDLMETDETMPPKHSGTKDGLCIFGPNGCGKTGLMVILCRRFYRQGFTPLFTKYLDLVKSVQGGYGVYADGDPRHQLSEIRIETAQRVSHLFLDDLGDPFGTGDDYDVPKDRRDILFQVLSARHERDRPTFITANYKRLVEISRQFDPRISDRVKEMCSVVKMNGPNLREQT